MGGAAMGFDCANQAGNSGENLVVAFVREVLAFLPPPPGFREVRPDVPPPVSNMGDDDDDDDDALVKVKGMGVARKVPLDMRARKVFLQGVGGPVQTGFRACSAPHPRAASLGEDKDDDG
jgi:hypothetical protein